MAAADATAVAAADVAPMLSEQSLYTALIWSAKNFTLQTCCRVFVLL